MKRDTTITGKRIYLRAMSVDDATKEYAGWLNDPAVHRFLDTKHTTTDKLRAYIAAKNESPDALLYGIFLHGSEPEQVLRDKMCAGKHIGTIKLEPLDTESRESAIAVMVGEKQYWGGGYGSEAMQLLIEYAFNTLGLTAIYLGVNAENWKAVLSYEKLGFRRIQDLRMASLSPRLFRLIEPRHEGEIVMALAREKVSHAT